MKKYLKMLRIQRIYNELVRRSNYTNISEQLDKIEMELRKNDKRREV